MPGKKPLTIPCAMCGIEPADPNCAVPATAFGLGEITVYLCPTDYAGVLRNLQAAQEQERERLQKRSDFEDLIQEAKRIAPVIYGGQWPDRETLVALHRHEEDLFIEARQRYRDLDDAVPEGQLARLQVMRLAALCLLSAIGVEAIEAGSAVSGTLFRVTMAIMKKGLTIPGKEFTREQVLNALLAILRYRETNPENETEEIQILSTQNQ